MIHSTKLARQQLHLNHVVSERPMTNGKINLYIKLEKHELDQKKRKKERSIRISLDKRIAFSK